MILVEDTRNQVGKHKQLNSDLESKGVKVIRSKLYVGDYARLDKQNIAIDTKKDWVEVAGNICGKQHERFRNECLRAKSVGIRLIILVEEQICVEQWKSPLNRQKKAYTQVKGETLAKAMRTMTEKYGVEFMNCSKERTAEVILNLLGE